MARESDNAPERVVLAFESLDADDLAPIDTFLPTEAGDACRRASIVALKSFTVRDPDGLAALTARLSDPRRVGSAAQEEFEQIASGRRATPDEAGHVLAARQLEPENAAALDAFLATPAGERWRRARGRTITQTRDALLGLRAAAAEQGLCLNPGTLEGRLPAYLPRRPK